MGGYPKWSKPRAASGAPLTVVAGPEVTRPSRQVPGTASATVGQSPAATAPSRA